MNQRNSGLPRFFLARSRFVRLVPLLAAAAFLCPGCLYFNMLYNAESSYDTAFKAHQKLLKNNPDSAITLPADVETGYKKAVTKCLKVFEVYPKSKKSHDKALFLMGKADFYLGEYDKAIRVFSQLQREFPASPLVPESFLYTGRAQLKNGNYEAAEKTLGIVQSRYPTLDKNQDVSMLMAQIIVQRQGKTQAVAMLEAAYKTAKTPDKKMELALKIAQLYRELKLYDKAMAFLRGAPRVRDLADQLYRVDYLLVACLADKEEYAQALTLVNTMLAFKPYYSRAVFLTLRKAELLESLGKLDEAVATYKQVTESSNGGDAVGVAWYELGFLYQTKLVDLKKAKECYDKALLSLKDADLKDTATKRSKAIDDILKYGEGKLPADTSKADSASGQEFKVGELYWLELDHPDSAYRYYCAAAADTIHRAMVPKALYAAAWIARYALKDSVKSDSLYHLLLKRFPSNLYSQKAEEARGDKITVFTRRDSASAAFDEAERIFYEDDNPDSAAAAYEEVYRRFRDSDFGPKALYAAAWIYDFVLDKNRTAKGLYETLCDSFPKSSYCANAAKPRIKTVTDSIAAFKSRRKAAAEQPPVKGQGIAPAAPQAPDGTSPPLPTDRDSLGRSTVPVSQPGMKHEAGTPPEIQHGMYRGSPWPSAPRQVQTPENAASQAAKPDSSAPPAPAVRPAPLPADTVGAPAPGNR
jgi:tetratricopeptide (TPR) repeat protein